MAKRDDFTFTTITMRNLPKMKGTCQSQGEPNRNMGNLPEISRIVHFWRLKVILFLLLAFKAQSIYNIKNNLPFREFLRNIELCDRA